LDKGATTGGEATTNDEAKAGYSTDGAAKPKPKKPATSGDEAGKGKKKFKPPKASAVIQNAKDAKTIQQLKETVNRVKTDASVKISALEEELAAFRAQANLTPEPKPKSVLETEPQPEPVHHPNQTGEEEPEPEPASKPEPTPEPDPEPVPTLPSLPSRADGAQEPDCATTPPTQP
jgi:hypothetical protein